MNRHERTRRLVAFPYDDGVRGGVSLGIGVVAFVVVVVMDSLSDGFAAFLLQRRDA